MCSVKQQENEMLSNLKGFQLYSVEILIDSIVIDRGPYKNTGNFDEISIDENDEDDDSDEMNGEGVVPTTGMTDESGTEKESQDPKAGDKNKEGRPKSKSGSAGRSRGKSREGEDRETCTRFPIDSWGPAINSKSGIVKPKRQRTPKKSKGENKSKDKRESGASSAEDDEQSSVQGEDKKSKKGGKDKTKKGKDKSSTPESGKTKSKGALKAKSKVKLTPPPTPPPKKKKKRRCPKPEIPKGPLPPLQVSISIFHVRDAKINQVDLDKLYPPEDALIATDESEPEIEVVGGDPKVSIARAGTLVPQAAKKLSVRNSEKKSVTGGAKKTMSKEPSVNLVGTTENVKAGAMVVSSETSKESQEDEMTLSRYRLVGEKEGAKCHNQKDQQEKMERSRLRSEKLRRREVIQSLRPITDFKRGLSFVFAARPFDIITRLMTDKMEIIIERCDIIGPALPVGKVRIKFPGIYIDRVQAGVRETTTKPLWTCQEDTYPVIDCKKRQVGSLSLYFCLTSLGRGMVSQTLLTASNLYDYTDSAQIIVPEPEVRATAFKTVYGNLQRVTHKDFDRMAEIFNEPMMQRLTSHKINH